MSSIPPSVAGSIPGSLDVLFHDAHLLIWELNGEGTLLRASQSHIEHLGVSPLEFCLDPLSFIHPQDHQVFRSSLSDALAGLPGEMQLRLRASDGSYYTSDWRLHPVLEKTSRVLVVGRPALGGESPFFRILAETAPGIAYMRSPNSSATMLFMSDGIRSLCGYGAAAFLSNRIDLDELCHPEEQDHVLAHKRRALEEHKEYEIAYRLRQRDDSYKPIREKGRGIYNGLGELIFVAASLADESEKKATEARCEELESQLKTEKVGKMEAGAAHEFNNLFMSIIGHIDLAYENLPSGSEERGALAHATAAVERAANLVRRLRDFSENQSRPQGPAKVPKPTTIAKKTRVLVVEDDQPVRHLVLRSLLRAGYDVSEAENGEVGLNRLEKESFDLILLDMRMPELDGYQFLERLKERESAPPVLAVSGYAERPIASHYPGAFDFLPKPYRTNELLKRVQALL